jgi:hypothetical protein
MFSRYGKETSNQYKCFAEEKPTTVESSLAMMNPAKINRRTKVTHDEIDFVLEKLRVRLFLLTNIKKEVIEEIKEGQRRVEATQDLMMIEEEASKKKKKRRAAQSLKNTAVFKTPGREEMYAYKVNILY